MVKALDLRSNGRMSSWVRTPLLVITLLDELNVIFMHDSAVFNFQPSTTPATTSKQALS